MNLMHSTTFYAELGLQIEFRDHQSVNHVDYLNAHYRNLLSCVQLLVGILRT